MKAYILMKIKKISILLTYKNPQEMKTEILNSKLKEIFRIWQVKSFAKNFKNKNVRCLMKFKYNFNEDN